MRPLALLPALLLAAGSAPAAEPVRVKVDYVFNAVSLEGGGRTPVQARWSLGATLVGNRVTDAWEGSTGRARTSGGGQETLGGGRWQVVNQSTLMRVTNWPNSETIVRVMVSGQACRATVESRLKPGRKVYVFRRISTGGLGEFAEPYYSDVQCSIG